MRSRLIVLAVAALATCAVLAPAARADWYGGPPSWVWHRPPPWAYRYHPHPAYGYRPTTTPFYLGRPPMINRPPWQNGYYGY